ncbi:hypothetical protein HSX11_01910 [Oxalobacteraceae bacterium]|nr:hypothetical protein [Oxalobacteraceae bacterium]
MRLQSILRQSAIALAAAIALAGCVTSQPPGHPSHHSSKAEAQPSATMEGGGAGARMGMMDKTAMCEKHKKMMSGKTPDEQKAMLEERMKSMPPEMKEKHLAMMREKCT